MVGNRFYSYYSSNIELSALSFFTAFTAVSHIYDVIKEFSCQILAVTASSQLIDMTANYVGIIHVNYVINKINLGS